MDLNSVPIHPPLYLTGSESNGGILRNRKGTALSGAPDSSLSCDYGMRLTQSQGGRNPSGHSEEKNHHKYQSFQSQSTTHAPWKWLLQGLSPHGPPGEHPPVLDRGPTTAPHWEPSFLKGWWEVSKSSWPLKFFLFTSINFEGLLK